MSVCLSIGAGINAVHYILVLAAQSDIDDVLVCECHDCNLDLGLAHASPLSGEVVDESFDKVRLLLPLRHVGRARGIHAEHEVDFPGAPLGRPEEL